MRYFKAKSAAGGSKNGANKRRGEDGTVQEEDQPASSEVPTPKWQQKEKVKDPYRRQRTGYSWKKGKKSSPPDEKPEDRKEERQEAGDVQAEPPSATPSCSGHEEVPVPPSPPPHDEHTMQPTSSCTAVVLVEPQPPLSPRRREPRHHKEQQTSTTFIGSLATRVAMRQRGLVLEQGAGAGSSGATEEVKPPEVTEVLEEEGEGLGDESSAKYDNRTALQRVTRTEEEVAVELVSVTGSPSDSTSLAASEDVLAGVGAGSVRQWQRSMLARLTRARQRRDIRLKRKEILSLQLLMEAVLKQHLALSREVETVKAKLQWESVEPLEPLSLGSALAKLHSERQEEAANFARILAAKEQELKQVHQLREQVSALKRACREKDEDLERAAATVATLRAFHQAKMQESRERMGEVLDHHTKEKQDLSEALQAKDIELAKAHQQALLASKRVAEHERAVVDKAGEICQLQKAREREVNDLKTALEAKQEKNAELAELCEQLRDNLESEKAASQSVVEEKDMVISKLRNQLATIESQREIESLSLSRALTDREMHIECLMRTNEHRAEEHAAEIKSFSRKLRDKDLAIDELKAKLDDALSTETSIDGELKTAKEDLEKYRVHQEGLMLIMSKALSARDDDAETMDTMKQEREKLVQEHRNAMDRLQSQKTVEVNEKEIMIGNLAIEVQRLKATVAERESHLLHLEAQYRMLSENAERKHLENSGLLKTIEAMNINQEESTRYLNQTFAQMEAAKQKAEFVSNELAKKELELGALRSDWEASRREHAVEMEALRAALEDVRARRSADADHFRKALHEKDVMIRDLQDRFQTFQEEHENSEKSLKEELQNKAAEIAHLTRNLETFHLQVQSVFEKRLREKDDLIKELDSQLRELDQIPHLQAANQNLEGKNEALEKEIGEMHEEIKTLKNSIQQMKTAHRDRAMELKRSQDKINELKANLKSLKTEKDETTTKLLKDIDNFKNSLEKEKSAHTQNVTMKQKEIESLTSNLEKIKSEHEGCGDLLKKKAEMQTQLRSLEQENKVNKITVDGLKKSLQERDGRLKVLENEAAKLKSDLVLERNSFEVVIEGKENEINQLKCSLESSQSELKNERQVLQTRLKDLEERYFIEINDIQQNRSRLENDLLSEKTRADNAEKMLEHAREEVGQLTKDALRQRKEQKTNICRLFRVIKAVTRKREAEFSALSQQLNIANESIDVLTNSHEEMTDENEMLKKMVAAKEVEMKQLSTNMTKCTNQLKVHQEAAHLYKEELETALESLNRLQSQNEYISHELALKEDAVKAYQLEEECLRKALEEKSAAFDDQIKTIEQLQLEVSLTQQMAKNAIEEHKAKIDQMNHSIQNARADMDSEITVLKNTIAKLEVEAVSHAKRNEHLDNEYRARIASLEASLASKDDDLEKMIDVEERSKREAKQLLDSHDELKKQISYLEKARAQQEEYTKRLQDQNTLMQRERTELEDRRRDLEENLRLSLSTIKERDDLVASMEVKFQNVIREMDIEIKRLKDSIARNEQEDEWALTELKEELDLQRQHVAMLQKDLMDVKESEARAYRNWEEERKQLELEKTEAEEHLLQVIKRTESDIRASLESTFETEREAAKRDLSLKDAELKLVNSTLDKLKSELRDATQASECQQRDLEAHRASSKAEKDDLLRLLAEKGAETAKLSQTVDTLKSSLAIQKRLLLTIPEGRAFFGLGRAGNGNDTGLRDTREETILSQAQDGDHTRPMAFRPDAELQPKRFHKKQILSMGEPQRGSALKRTASEGDHLDIADLMDLSDLSFSSMQTPSSTTLANTTASEASNAPSPLRSISAFSRIA